MQQLPLSFLLDESGLRSYLESGSGKKVFLVITDNTYSMLSLHAGRSPVRLRLHRIFLHADCSTLDEIVRYIKNNTIKTPLIRDFINSNSHRIGTGRRRDERLRHVGRYYNLLDLYTSLNREYFGDRINAAITWTSKGPRSRARRRTLGSYNYYTNTIRINPVLDTKRIPRYYIEYIIYHEMLHADMGIKAVSGINTYHPEEFREREKHFRYYKKALKMEKRDPAA